LGWTFDPTFKAAFDVMAHWGTLLAVLAVFWRDLWGFVLGWLRTLGIGRLPQEPNQETEADPSAPAPPAPARGGFWARIQQDVDGRLAWLILIGSIPAALAGLLFEDFFEMLFGTPRIVSMLLLVTAGLLAFSEWRGKQGRDLPSLRGFDALFIGLGQATAIAPGISRSGATMAFGLMRGVRRDAAARFSFLLSTPVIVGAGVWQLKDMLTSTGWTTQLGPLIVGFVAAAISGYACIRFLLGYLRRGKLYSFAVYCTAFGLFCLAVSFIR
jgi:undecaprenyl-diphosphatase